MRSNINIYPTKTNTFLRQLKQYRLLLLMLLPALIYFILFHYVPMFGVVLAFKTYDFQAGILGSPWCGWKNFEFLFASGKALKLTWNTFAYNAAFIVVGTVLQIGVAVILSELSGRYFKKICQSFLFLPYFISWVVVGTMAYNLLNYRYGFINSFLTSMGFKAINFYTKPQLWKYIIVAFNTWKGLGYGSVLYLAAITGIDAEIYESAQIDGASLIQRITHITIPCLVPTIITLTLLNIGGIFRGNFQLFYNLVGQNGLLYNATDVIDTYVFRSLMAISDFGMTSAAGLFQSVLCFVTIMAVNGIVKKVDSDSALF